MSQEGQLIGKKSWRAVTGRNADWDGLAKDCVAFANAQGGRLLIGIEDEATLPEPSQRIDPSLVDVVRRKIGERTVNVSVLPEIRHAEMAANTSSCTCAVRWPWHRLPTAATS